MTTKTQRKANTALVFNPNRGRTLAVSNPRRRTAKRRSVRRNPVSKSFAAGQSVPRRSNPSTASGLLMAAVAAGIGVSAFDYIASRLLPLSSPLVGTAVKFGGAFLFQSNVGSKVPVLGKYKNDIALVLAVSGMIDLMRAYVFPLVGRAVGSVVAPALPAAPAAGAVVAGGGDGTTAGLYGNSRIPGVWTGVH